MAKVTIPNSGLWSTIASYLNSMFTDLFRGERYGFYQYNDLTTQSTPISIALANTWYKLTNDGNTKEVSHGITGLTDIWRVATNDLYAGDLNHGDVVYVQVELHVTTAAPNQIIEVDLVLGVGGTEDNHPLIPHLVYKNAGETHIVGNTWFCLLDDNIRLNPAEIRIRSDGTGSVKVDRFAFRAVRREYEHVSGH